MGTRADFYVGREWIGSLAFDGYRIHEMKDEHASHNEDSRCCQRIKCATSEEDYRAAVRDLLDINDDATKPDQGWPWPWEDSRTTDRAYVFDGSKVRFYAWGKEFDPADEDDASNDDPEIDGGWPDMTSQQSVTLGQRSGLIFVGG